MLRVRQALRLIGIGVGLVIVVGLGPIFGAAAVVLYALFGGED